MDPELKKRALEYLMKTPNAMLFCFCSFFSGQLWVFLITTYLKRTQKGNSYLNKFYSKLGIGGFWLVVFNSPFYFNKHKTYNFDFLIFLDVFCNTLMIAVFVQLLVFIAVTAFFKERKNVK